MKAAACLLLLTIALWRGPATAETANIAVAANFAAPARMIAQAFEGKTRLSMGATGQLFLQISQGAPYDVFLAADQARPALAIKDSFAVDGTSFTYALGRLVLYSRDVDVVKGPNSLKSKGLRKLAIANPVTAPYGLAAIQTLRSLGLETALAPKLVRGKNIAQTYQFTALGAADMGFIAASLLTDAIDGSRWAVPAHLHAPIAQDAVLLARGAANTTASAFLAFLKGPEALAIISRYGYDAPMQTDASPKDG